jgi:hypothetical protein
MERILLFLLHRGINGSLFIRYSIELVGVLYYLQKSKIDSTIPVKHPRKLREKRRTELTYLFKVCFTFPMTTEGVTGSTIWRESLSAVHWPLALLCTSLELRLLEVYLR